MRGPLAIAVASVLVLISSAGCRGALGPKYEYEEQFYLSVDGSATVVIDASIAALVALRGLRLDPALSARVDRDGIASAFSGPECGQVRVGQPWVRDGRHFVQIRLDTPDVRQLGRCAPMAWAQFVFEKGQAGIHYAQLIGAAAAGNPGEVNWTGTELIAVRLHLPGRIVFHNVKRLDGTNGEAERGNILTWEQTLSDRLAGKPLDLDVRMGADSILFRTLSLFAGAFAAAVIVLAGVIWVTIRRAKKSRARVSSPAT